MTSAMDNDNCEHRVCTRNEEKMGHCLICMYLTVLPADPSSGKCKYYTPYISLLKTPFCSASVRKVLS